MRIYLPADRWVVHQADHQAACPQDQQADQVFHLADYQQDRWVVQACLPVGCRQDAGAVDPAWAGALCQ